MLYEVSISYVLQVPSMSVDQIIVLVVFVLVFAGIISEKLDKTIIVLGAGIGLIMAGFLNFEQAIHAIDFNTICLLMGMMVLVEALRHVGLFDWLAIKLAILTRGNPVLIFFFGGLVTASLSAFLDNVTTVLVIVPLIISLTQGMGLPPKPFILSIIFMSNIGGTATLIGDPPNILIGSQVPELTFMAFIQYLTPPVLISTVFVLMYLRWRNSDVIRSRSANFPWLFMSNLMLQDIRRRESALKLDPSVMWRACSIFAVVLLGFFTHAVTHLDPAVVALAGATVMLAMFHKDINLHHLIAHVEWPTLLFFSGLFIVVGAMEHTGVLELFSHSLVSVTSNLLLLILLVLWASAILSAVVDNIPFVAVMIPVLKDLSATPQFTGDPKVQLLWWALALGACFGGNGSMIGASANVVSCAIARSKGAEIGFKEFARTSVPVTLLTIVVSSVYLTLLYLF